MLLKSAVTSTYRNITVKISKSGPVSRNISRTSEIDHLNFEVRSPKSEVGTQKSKVGSRKSEVESRKSEVGSRKSEVGSRKSLLGFRRYLTMGKAESYL